MFTPINPENERIRAENTLRSFTEQENAAHLFGSQTKRRRTPSGTTERTVNASTLSVTRLFKAIRLNRRAAEPAPQVAPQSRYADKRATLTS